MSDALKERDEQKERKDYARVAGHQPTAFGWSGSTASKDGGNQ